MENWLYTWNLSLFHKLTTFHRILYHFFMEYSHFNRKLRHSHGILTIFNSIIFTFHAKFSIFYQTISSKPCRNRRPILEWRLPPGWQKMDKWSPSWCHFITHASKIGPHCEKKWKIFQPVVLPRLSLFIKHLFLNDFMLIVTSQSLFVT